MTENCKEVGGEREKARDREIERGSREEQKHNTKPNSTQTTEEPKKL